MVSHGASCRRKQGLLSSIALWFALALPAACTFESRRTPEDDRALEEVRRQFGERVEVDLEAGLYVRARMQPGVTLSAPATDSVYRAFFFTPGGERRDTRYVYLNVYQPDGRFLVQLYYDPKRNSISRGRTEHY